jgi:hypothetical protein
MNYNNRLLLAQVSLLFQKKVIKFQSDVLQFVHIQSIIVGCSLNNCSINHVITSISMYGISVVYLTTLL